MTAEQKKRVVAEIAETQRLIEKEMKYMEHLRKQQYLDSLHSHMNKLQSLIAA